MADTPSSISEVIALRVYLQNGIPPVEDIQEVVRRLDSIVDAIGDDLGELRSEIRFLRSELDEYRRLADRSRHARLGYKDGRLGTPDDVRRRLDEMDKCLRSCHSSIAHLLNMRESERD